MLASVWRCGTRINRVPPDFALLCRIYGGLGSSVLDLGAARLRDAGLFRSSARTTCRFDRMYLSLAVSGLDGFRVSAMACCNVFAYNLSSTFVESPLLPNVFFAFPAHLFSQPLCYYSGR